MQQLRPSLKMFISLYRLYDNCSASIAHCKLHNSSSSCSLIYLLIVPGEADSLEIVTGKIYLWGDKWKINVFSSAALCLFRKPCMQS